MAKTLVLAERRLSFKFRLKIPFGFFKRFFKAGVGF
jgi:hypothetical protein